jgi:hypothetical protein
MKRLESHDLALFKGGLDEPRIHLSLSLSFESSFHGFGLNSSNEASPSLFLVQNTLDF